MAPQAGTAVAFLLTGALLAVLAACSPGEPPPPPPAREPPPAEKAPAPAAAQGPPAPSRHEERERLRKIWEEGAKRIRLLDPDRFPEAPPELRQALQKLGCRIPQTYATDLGPEYFDPPRVEVQENLVSGHFKSTSEVHWAVLCSKSGETSLLLFDSLGENMEKLKGPEKNSNFLIAGSSNDDPVFSWSIDVANQQGVLEEFDRYGTDEKRPPTILQEALSSSYNEYISTIYYWHRCKWVPISPPGC